MLKRVIEWSVRNQLVVLLLTVVAVLGGIWAVKHTPLEALPDLSDVQVIVQADYAEQAPRIVEDQVTYPISTEMLKVPGARSVRGQKQNHVGDGFGRNPFAEIGLGHCGAVLRRINHSGHYAVDVDAGVF